MSLAVLLGALLTVTPVEQAETSFSSGDFEQALTQLVEAERLAPDSATRVRVLLLRGQTLAALRRYELVEVAFTAALTEDAEARLDPERVDPTVVAILEGLRNRLVGTLVVDATPSGAHVWLDGKEVGVAPYERHVSPTSHTVEARWERGSQQQAVLVQAGARVAVQLVQPEAPPNRDRVWFLEARAAWSPPGLGFSAMGGAGVRFGLFGASLQAVAARFFGLELRAQLDVPLQGRWTPYVSADGALFFAGPAVPGLGAAAGLRVRVWGELTPFIEVGYRHLFTVSFQPDAFLLALGLRWASPLP